MFRTEYLIVLQTFCYVTVLSNPLKFLSNSTISINQTTLTDDNYNKTISTSDKLFPNFQFKLETNPSIIVDGLNHLLKTAKVNFFQQPLAIPDIPIEESYLDNDSNDNEDNLGSSSVAKNHRNTYKPSYDVVESNENDYHSQDFIEMNENQNKIKNHKITEPYEFNSHESNYAIQHRKLPITNTDSFKKLDSRKTLNNDDDDDDEKEIPNDNDDNDNNNNNSNDVDDSDNNNNDDIDDSDNYNDSNDVNEDDDINDSSENSKIEGNTVHHNPPIDNEHINDNNPEEVPVPSLSADDKLQHNSKESLTSHMSSLLPLYSHRTSENSNFNNNNNDRIQFQIHGVNGPKSYEFGYDTGKGKDRQYRFEERDNEGVLNGEYGYIDNEGKLIVMKYSSDPLRGFQMEQIQ